MVRVFFVKKRKKKKKLDVWLSIIHVNTVLVVTCPSVENSSNGRFFKGKRVKNGHFFS